MMRPKKAADLVIQLGPRSQSVCGVNEITSYLSFSESYDSPTVTCLCWRSVRSALDTQACRGVQTVTGHLSED